MSTTPMELCYYSNNIRDGLRAARKRETLTPADTCCQRPSTAELDATALQEHLAALYRIEACDCSSCEACLASTAAAEAVCSQVCADAVCAAADNCADCVTECASTCSDEECDEQCVSICGDEACQEAHVAGSLNHCELDDCRPMPCELNCASKIGSHTPCSSMQSWDAHALTDWPAHDLSCATEPFQRDQHGLGTPLSLTDASIQSSDELMHPPGIQQPDSQVPFHCHWNACDLAFIDATAFDQHFWIEHAQQQAQQQNLHCAWNDCAAAPLNETALFDHVKHDHVEVETHHRCKWLIEDANGKLGPCGLCLPTVEELTKHITDMHVGSRKKSYACMWQGCEREHRPFAQRQKIIRHLVTHTGDRPFVCKECGYQCSQESVLEQHMRTHTGERPFQCTVCDKAFSASTALSVHMRTHTGYKPLVCKFPGCNKRFSESSNLAKHMRTHSADRPHVCEVPGCGRAFQRQDQLKRHAAKVHKGSQQSKVDERAIAVPNRIFAS